LSNVIIKCFYITFLYNVIMPRKKGDDDELRRKALELRRKGLSYVQIGKQLGRSGYKAWELVSPYERHEPKILQVTELEKKIAELHNKIAELNARINAKVAEPDKKIAELNAKIDTLSKVADDMSTQLKRVKTIRDLGEGMHRIDAELTSLKERVESISKNVESMDSGLKRFPVPTELFEEIVRIRNKDPERRCRNMDEGGFCTAVNWQNKIEGAWMTHIIERDTGKTYYKMNVERRPLTCVPCTKYEPRVKNV